MIYTHGMPVPHHGEQRELMLRGDQVHKWHLSPREEWTDEQRAALRKALDGRDCSVDRFATRLATNSTTIYDILAGKSAKHGTWRRWSKELGIEERGRPCEEQPLEAPGHDRAGRG